MIGRDGFGKQTRLRCSSACLDYPRGAAWVGEVVGTGEHLRRRTKRQSEKEGAASRNNEEKTIRKRGTRTYRPRHVRRGGRNLTPIPPEVEHGGNETEKDRDRSADRSGAYETNVAMHVSQKWEKKLRRARAYIRRLYIRTHDKNEIKTFATGDQPFL